DRWIDAHKKGLVDLSCRLVNIDTTVPPGRNYPKISQLLAGELKDIGITPSVSYIPEATIRRRVSPEVGLKGPRPNTFATLKGEGEGPKILLNGHVDVVPADPSGWSNDPFKPIVKNGKIYGRGSEDMKGSDACQIYSLKALVETGAKFRGNIQPPFTTEEELKKLGVQVAKRRSKINAEPIWGTKKMRPGLYVNTAKGGLKGNIIPDTFEILVDRRFIPEEKAPQVQREVEQVVRDFAAKHREVKVSMKPVLGYDPMITPPNHPLIRTVRRVARKVLGRDVPPCGSQGSTDVAAVTALGVPVAVLGTTRRDSNIHGI